MPKHEADYNAIVQAGNIGGEYLDSLGKTDLAMFSKEEWETFVYCIVKGYHEVAPLLAEQEIPF